MLLTYSSEEELKEYIHVNTLNSSLEVGSDFDYSIELEDDYRFILSLRIYSSIQNQQAYITINSLPTKDFSQKVSKTFQFRE